VFSENDESKAEEFPAVEPRMISETAYRP